MMLELIHSHPTHSRTHCDIMRYCGQLVPINSIVAMHKMHILLLLQLMLYILNICFILLLLLFMMRSNDEIG